MVEAAPPAGTEHPVPPEAERELGLGAYLTSTPGIGGRLRTEIEDFQVIELGDDPPRRDGRFSVARIRLTNWETNRFVGRAAHELRLRRNQVGFAGMKDKRAITEQWFSFQCAPERVAALGELQDVEITVPAYRTSQRQFAGAHGGNRFILRVRGDDDHPLTPDPDALTTGREQILAAGGVPDFFGPQRFGSAIRPVTPRIGAAIVAGDLEEAVRLFVGNPFPHEPEATRDARALYEDTRDPAAALAVFPDRLDLEKSVLQRLAQQPDAWRPAIMALPKNLLQLFVHSHQSLAFNRIVSARIEAGLGISTAHVGDRVIAHDADGTASVLVTPANQARVQRELDKGRATVTAPLPGLDTESAEGEMGDIEARVLSDMGIEARDFRCRELPQLASQGRRRGVRLRIDDLHIEDAQTQPVVSFSLGKGSYATVVMREFMKAELSAY